MHLTAEYAENLPQIQCAKSSGFALRLNVCVIPERYWEWRIASAEIADASGRQSSECETGTHNQ
jgi:hypothetical protein